MGIDIFVRAVLVGGAYRAALAFIVVRSPKSGYHSCAGFSTLNNGKLPLHFTESDKRKNRLAHNCEHDSNAYCQDDSRLARQLNAPRSDSLIPLLGSRTMPGGWRKIAIALIDHGSANSQLVKSPVFNS
jgi:hypothetical protein